MVCRELNLGFAQDALQTNYFGGEAEEILTTGVKCQGSERNLSDCYHSDVSQSHAAFCPGNRKSFAAVICTDRKI